MRQLFGLFLLVGALCVCLCGQVVAQDDMLAADPAEASVMAEYNPGTGEFWIRATEIQSWSVVSQDSLFTNVGAIQWPAAETTPFPVPPSPGTSQNEIGEFVFVAGFDMQFSHVDGGPAPLNPDNGLYYLGQILEPGAFGLDINNSNVGEHFAVDYVYYDAPGHTTAGVGTINVVPEPGTILMVLSGLIGLALVAWRRRRAK